jgi:hypothetical protein
MQKKTVIKAVAGIAVVLLIVFGAVRCNRVVDIDSCLDMGGRWNYETKECEGQRNGSPRSNY